MSTNDEKLFDNAGNISESAVTVPDSAGKVPDLPDSAGKMLEGNDLNCMRQNSKARIRKKLCVYISCSYKKYKIY
ncbi:hypothetical protein K040078D81_11440 [Blautia hominis]|uniref:Uncharacterized protein n=1 Tax=Blautia hominis TaxID=2025493 RepID=A0ABQ0B6E9_9FIRM